MVVLAAMQLSSLLFLTGLALVAGVLLLRVRRQASQAPDLPERAPAKKKRPGYSAPPPVPPDPVQERSVEHWEVQIHELARDLTAQIETRMGVLQQFIRVADEQAVRLEALLRKAENLGVMANLPPLPGADDPGNPPPVDSATSDLDDWVRTAASSPLESPSYQLADAPEDPIVEESQYGDDVPAELPPSAEPQDSSMPRLDRLPEVARPHGRAAPAVRDADDIYRLADYGMQAEEIATQVGRPIGEIRLILALRERRPAR